MNPPFPVRSLVLIVSFLLPLILFAQETPQNPVLDHFGVAQIYPSVTRGRTWYSKWDNGDARQLGGQIDPDDPEFDTNHGDARYSIDGKGVLTASGEVPRMYVYDPEGKKSWTNVEITVYGMRVKETKPVGWAGLMAYAKTDHRVDSDTCKTRGYGGRLTYDGRADFEKETAHGKSNGYVQVSRVKPWPRESGMPSDVWIGYKFIVRDAGQGKKVELEMWMDTTGGKNGGDWKRLTQYLDEGDFGKGADACDPGTDPAAVLSGPFPVVYLRTDSVEGMRYKAFSIREIEPLP